MNLFLASILNLAGPDLMVVLLIVLLLFGSKKLPELARGMGRAIKEFGAAREEIVTEMNQSGANGATLDSATARRSAVDSRLGITGNITPKRIP